MRWTNALGSLLLIWSVDAQTSFHITLDSLQVTGGGTGLSVREVDGGYLLFCAQISPDCSGETHLLIHKIDGAGNHLWARDYGAGANYGFGFSDPLSAIAGDSIYSGVTRFGPGFMDIYFTVFDLNGDSIRSTPLAVGDTLYRSLRSVIALDEGGFMLCGWVQQPGGSSEGLLIRTGPAGDTLWTRTYPDIAEWLSLDTCYDGGFFAAGYRYNPPNTCIRRLDSLGNEIWTRWLGGDHPFFSISVIMGRDSSAMACATYNEESYPLEFNDQMVVKYNPNGALIWQERFIPFYYSNTYDLIEMDDGSIVVGGYHAPRTSITKLSAEGDSLWSRAYRYYDGSSSSRESPRDLELTSDGGFILTGEIDQASGDPHPELQTIFALKADSCGCLVPGCQFFDNLPEMEVDAVHLLTWPNPSSGMLYISLRTVRPQNGEIRMLDAAGREVLRFDAGGFGEEIVLDVRDQAPGRYFLQFTSKSRIMVTSQVVIKR